MRMPDTEHYADGEVIFSSAFPDAVGVLVGTNLWEDQAEQTTDRVPIRIQVMGEDDCSLAYLTVEDAYELVQALGNAITKAKQIERGPDDAS